MKIDINVVDPQIQVTISKLSNIWGLQISIHFQSGPSYEHAARWTGYGIDSIQFDVSSVEEYKGDIIITGETEEEIKFFNFPYKPIECRDKDTDTVYLINGYDLEVEHPWLARKTND